MYFFTVLYRSPNQSQIELEVFIDKFDFMLSKMAPENPYCVVIIGDCNARSAQWWENDLENDASKLFEPFTADVGLKQLISQPAHIIDISQSCIGFILPISQIFTLNLVLMALYINNVTIKLCMVKY